MKSLFSVILCAFALMACLVSCDHGSSLGGAVTFDTLSIDTICPLFKNYNKPACHLTINIAKPNAETSEGQRMAVDRFMAQLLKDGELEIEPYTDMQSRVENYVKSYLNDYLNEGVEAIDNYGDDIEATATWMSYEQSIIGKAIYNQDGLLSYQMTLSSYTGGAHGNFNTYNGVFNLETRESVALESLFDTMSYGDLNAMLQRKLADQYECETVQELTTKASFFAPEELEANDNFYIDETGITWTFDPYEIAPFSEGTIVVSLTWDDVYPLLRGEAPVMKLAVNH